MLSAVSGIQERHNIHELLFMEEVTGRMILSLRSHVARMCLSGGDMWVLNSREQMSRQPAGGLDPGLLEFWSWGQGTGDPGTWCSRSRSCSNNSRSGGGSVLSGTVISPVGSLIIGIICPPGFFL